MICKVSDYEKALFLFQFCCSPTTEHKTQLLQRDDLVLTIISIMNVINNHNEVKENEKIVLSSLME